MRRQGNSSGRHTPSLHSPIQFLKGVGPKRAEAFGRLGVRTIGEALFLLPLRHEDRRHLRSIREIRPGNRATVVGKVSRVYIHSVRRRFKILTVQVEDGTGALTAKWFQQPYLKRRFPLGRRVVLSGTIGPGPRLEMVNPDYEEWEDDAHTHAGRIVPIYPLVEGLSQRWLRSFMKSLVAAWAPAIADFQPQEILDRHGLTGLSHALRVAHFPDQSGEAEAGKRRLAFDDLLLLSIGIARLRRAVEVQVTNAMAGSPRLERAVRTRLGFHLTPGQERVLTEIKSDMARCRPMTRLLQGDVGSGKTAVAFLAMAHAVGSGFQGAIMAPTEILAEQHHRRARALLAPAGIRIGYLSGGMSARDRERLRRAIAAGELQGVIGTHALLQEEVTFHRLGLVIVDEQHRFGVRQRAELAAKGSRPHTLIMTATPIPRTLALTIYGDLDLSIIDEMPPGRRPVKTELWPEERRGQVYRFVKEQVEKGGAAYVICPLVDEGGETDLKAATRVVAELREGALRGNTLACLHGRMRTEEKRVVMDAFRDGTIQVLVATTVVEVGMDVPRATVVVVEHAERLGLTQLHQIRGRVGRAHDQAYCLLIHGSHLTPEGRARLEAMVHCTDGFQIAERDLELRGPGEFFGTRQAGLPGLGVTQLLGDVRLLEAARREAFKLVEDDPGLIRHAMLGETFRRRWEGALELATVG